jgi:hypothetical protein
MKRISFVSLLLLLIFSCSKTTEENQEIIKVDTSHCPIYDALVCSGILCQSDTCQTYFPIWKNQFLIRNQMSQNYFNSRITPCSSKIVNWVDGISIEISYKVKTDWAEAVLTDRFAIWLSKTTIGLYPSIDVPRNTLLNEDQISSLITSFAFSSSINSVATIGHLKYSSLQEAMKALIVASKVDTLCTGNVFFQSPNLSAPPIGDPFIEASGTLNWEENKCITCQMNLVTGEADVFYNNCIFIL